ncbi:GGDEF domain-containing protein [Aliiglaciecola sp. LCG003]|uniref:GGDEF domain-containing protein n=1 Tax=Aliiglaciecola sp. LCG003 TaxID=3053655 RepID=UPI0025742242|nr:GGDEF domain-containing protein [Aliiglaciecola sp. LCG003]WJG08834.1 GGDEF domain-containing protein [Aliiglaciecola sp. LCG003]
MNIDTTRHLLTRKTAFYMLILVIVATIFRPILVNQSIVFTLVGVLNCVLLGLLYLYINNTKPSVSHAYMLIAIGFATILPLTIISGGVNSQFAVLLPITPVVICLLTNARTTLISSFFLIVVILLMVAFEHDFPNYAAENLSQSKTYSRAFWLCLSALLSCFFGIEFDRLSRKLSHKLRLQATIDGLTGIYNRRSVIEFLDDSILNSPDERSWISVLMIDADNFKIINDSYGHLFGDECLKQIAKNLKQNTRKNVDALGRYGGEEFLVVLNDVDQSQTHLVAEKIRQSIEQISMEFEGEDVPITVSIGYCCLRGSEIQSTEQLLQAADEALYVGKKSGRNVVVGAEDSRCTAKTLNQINSMDAAINNSKI